METAKNVINSVTGVTASKPIILYSHATVRSSPDTALAPVLLSPCAIANSEFQQGPNPWKVAIILEELGLPYETKFVEMPDMKKEPFEKLNPNGRVPAVEDPNTGIVLWESGAIVEYLCETYDPSNKLSYGNSSPQKHQLRQWLYFQVSL